MTLATLGATLASALFALVCGIIYAEVNSNGQYRTPSWGTRGTATFHATLLMWLAGFTYVVIYMLYRRKYASFIGMLLGGLLAVSIYYNFITELL
ncbi:hypothetical protein [Hymenobacter coalescens]